MEQGNIPLTVKGLPDEEKIAEEDFSHLPDDMQASLARMAKIREERSNTSTKFKFTGQQIADAEANAAFHNPRQQD